MEETPQAGSAEPQETPVARGRSPLLAVGVLVLAIGLGGGGGYIGVSRVVAHPRPEPTAVAAPASNPAPLYTVENLVVNPAGTKGSRFLIVTIALQPAQAGVVEDLKQLDPELRDAFGHLLSGLTVDQLSDMAMRDTLKQRLASAAEHVLHGRRIDTVYLPQFVLQ